MHKKLVIGFSVLLISFVFTLLSTDTVSAESIEEDYKELVEKLKFSLENDYSDEQIKQLPEVIEFNEKYTEEEINSFIKKRNLIRQIDEEQITASSNEKIISERDDGLVVSMENETVESNKKFGSENDEIITPYGGFNYMKRSGTTMTTTATYRGTDLTGTAFVLSSKTNYTVFKNYIRVNYVNHTGTYSRWPSSVSANGKDIVSNNTSRVQGLQYFELRTNLWTGLNVLTYSPTLKTVVGITTTSGDYVRFYTQTSTLGL